MRIIKGRFGNQRGDSKVMNILIVLVIATLVISLWKFGLPFFKYAQLNHFVKLQVNYDRENYTMSPTMIRSIHAKVINRARQLNLPVKEENIKADYEWDRATVEVNYIHPVNLFVTTYNWSFHIERSSEGVGFKKH